VDEGYDWKLVVQKFLFTDKQPLVSSITAGCMYTNHIHSPRLLTDLSVGQPLIHLALALQMSNRDLAMEALTLVATRYHDNNIFKYSNVAAYFQAEPSYKASSIPEILEKVRADETLTNTAFATPGEQNLSTIFRDHETTLLNHCNAWTIISPDPTATFRESQAAAVALFLGAKTKSVSQDENTTRRHDINLLYPLLMSHAIRIVLPQTPDKFNPSLLKQWWLTTLAIYIAQLRPEIESSDSIIVYDLNGKDWDWIARQAVKGPHASDTHFVLALRVLKEFSETWDDAENYYLRAAVKFVHEFNGWNISV
jgi:Questin oxidase-like